MSSALARQLGLAAWAAAGAALCVAALALGDATHPLVPLGLMAGAGVVVLAALRPFAALLLGVGLLPLELFALPTGQIDLTPSQGVFIVTALVWVGRRMVATEAPWTPSPITRPLGLLLLANVPGLAVAPDPATALRVIFVWVTLFFLAQMVIAEAGPHGVRQLLGVLAASAAVIGVVAMATSSGPQLSDLGDTAAGRAVGSFDDPNILATCLALALPGALAYALIGPATLRPFALVAFGLIFGGLALSLSRSGFLAAAAGLAVMLRWRPVRRTALVAALLVGALAALQALPASAAEQVDVIFKRIESVKYSGANQSEQRGLMYRTTPRIFLDHWATGVGQNQFPEIGPEYGLIDPVSGGAFQHSHNILLTIAAELGILGLVALVWLVVALVRALRPACAPRAGPRQGLGIAVAAALFALVVQGMLDYTLRSNAVISLAFVLMGAAAVLARAAQADEEAPGAYAAAAR